MKKYLILFCAMLLMITGCSQSSPNQDAFDVLKAAFEKTNSVKSLKQTSTLTGTQFDQYGEGVGQISRSASGTDVYCKTDQTTYTIMTSTEDNFTPLLVDYYQNGQRKEISGWIEGSSYYFSSFFDLGTDDISNYITTPFLEDSKYLQCYEFTQTKTDNEIVIVGDLVDSQKYAVLEKERLTKIHSDYDPLIASNGIKFTKHDYNELDYEFHINQEGMITSYSIITKTDYGVGYDDVTFKVTLSDFNAISLNTQKLDQLLLDINSGMITNGASISQYFS